jgi:hypothetical protein
MQTLTTSPHCAVGTVCLHSTKLMRMEPVPCSDDLEALLPASPASPADVAPAAGVVFAADAFGDAPQQQWQQQQQQPQQQQARSGVGSEPSKWDVVGGSDDDGDDDDDQHDGDEGAGWGVPRFGEAGGEKEEDDAWKVRAVAQGGGAR